MQVEHQVVGDRHAEHQTLVLAVLGDVGDPGPQRLARCRPVMSLPSRRTDPAWVGAKPEQRLRQLGLAVALHAGQRHHLAGADRQVDVVDRGHAAVVGDGQAGQLEHRVARPSACFLRTTRSTLRPTIIVARSSSLDSAGVVVPTTRP